MEKRQLLATGLDLLKEFCEANNFTKPHVQVLSKVPYGTCAYYREVTGIVIAPSQCAGLGYGGMAWSWPGYVIDRTPHGVIQHELGHAVDFHLSDTKGAYYGDFSVQLRRKTREDRITSYCPNDAEWFAEIFRLFVTNSDLLKRLRPRTYELIREQYRPVVDRPWQEVLKGAPPRTLQQAAKKIGMVA